MKPAKVHTPAATKSSIRFGTAGFKLDIYLNLDTLIVDFYIHNYRGSSRQAEDGSLCK